MQSNYKNIKSKLLRETKQLTPYEILLVTPNDDSFFIYKLPFRIEDLAIGNTFTIDGEAPSNIFYQPINLGQTKAWSPRTKIEFTQLNGVDYQGRGYLFTNVTFAPRGNNINLLAANVETQFIFNFIGIGPMDLLGYSTYKAVSLKEVTFCYRTSDLNPIKYERDKTYSFKAYNLRLLTSGDLTLSKRIKGKPRTFEDFQYISDFIWCGVSFMQDFTQVVKPTIWQGKDYLNRDIIFCFYRDSDKFAYRETKLNLISSDFQVPIKLAEFLDNRLSKKKEFNHLIALIEGLQFRFPITDFEMFEAISILEGLLDNPKVSHSGDNFPYFPGDPQSENQNMLVLLKETWKKKKSHTKDSLRNILYGYWLWLHENYKIDSSRKAQNLIFYSLDKEDIIKAISDLAKVRNTVAHSGIAKYSVEDLVFYYPVIEELRSIFILSVLSNVQTISVQEATDWYNENIAKLRVSKIYLSPKKFFTLK